MSRFKPVNVDLNAEPQAEADRIFERIQGAFLTEARNMARLMASKDERHLFGQTEFELRDRVHALGAEVLEVTAADRSKKGGYQGSSCVCPHCQNDARFVSRRGNTVMSLLGPLPLSRCYYHCRDCGYGQVPWDTTLGLHEARLTPATTEVSCLAGLQTSFAESSERTLIKMTGIRLSALA